MNQQHRLAVLGSPIAHSKSPALHSAAYRVLGLDWAYEPIEMTSDRVADFVGSLGREWRGLSVTMPVKHAIIPLLDHRDRLVDLTGACNTVLFDGGVRHGYNTDVYGIAQAFREAGVTRVETARILGGGATAASAIAALADLGARRITVAVRSPERAGGLRTVAQGWDLEFAVRSLYDEVDEIPDAVVSTLPNGVSLGGSVDERLCRDSILFDVAYEPWPSALAMAWNGVGSPVISGLEMLLHQAVMQVRIFTGGGPDAPLAREPEVIAAMRAAIIG